MLTFSRSSEIPASAEEVFRWHTRPGAFQRLVPPWQSATLVKGGDSLRPGSRAEIEMHIGPVRQTWIAEHTEFIEGRQFQDVQVSGPFAEWKHTHRMIPLKKGTCLLEDSIEYRLPGGGLGERFASRYVHKQLERLFKYRHRTTIDDLRQHQSSQGSTSMKILVSGSTGLVGSALLPFLTTGGHEVIRLVRGQAENGAVRWSPSQNEIDQSALEGLDAVVHLAGENISEGRWNNEKKARIRDSRVQGTKLISDALAKLESPPKTLICASAIGYYGDQGDAVMTEESAPADDFLGTVCQEWEAAAEPARKAGIRVVNLRIGVVLSPAGGALAKMLLPFKLGAGGVVGSGKQYMSWIAVDDLVGVIHHVLVKDALTGPVNAVAPESVTNREFTKTLGRVLKRPTVLPMPGFAARLALGEMADALLLSSTRVKPARLEQSGYTFRFPELEPALRHLLGRD